MSNMTSNLTRPPNNHDDTSKPFCRWSNLAEFMKQPQSSSEVSLTSSRSR